MHGTTANIRLGNLAHLDSTHYARGDAMALESVLESKCIHAGGKHADVISLSTIHAFCRASKTTEDIAAANGYSKLDSVINDFLDLNSQFFNDLRINTVAGLSHQCFARELQENTLVLIVRCHGHFLS